MSLRRSGAKLDGGGRRRRRKTAPPPPARCVTIGAPARRGLIARAPEVRKGQRGHLWFVSARFNDTDNDKRSHSSGNNVWALCDAACFMLSWHYLFFYPVVFDSMANGFRPQLVHKQYTIID